jgi:CheY-like chemotaxis protein
MSATILFVDDERDVLDSLKRVFLEEELRVLIADSAEKGLKIIDEQRVDLVVADYRMPGINGAELLTRVHARRDGTVGILLSAYADASLVESLGQQGVIYTFIAKPWNDDELRLAVRRGLEHRQARVEWARLQGELDRLRGALGRLPFGLVVFQPDGTVALMHSDSSAAPVNKNDIFTRRPDVGHDFRAFLAPEAAAAVKRVFDDGVAATIRSAEGQPLARCLPAAAGGAVLLVDRGGLVLPEDAGG